MPCECESLLLKTALDIQRQTAKLVDHLQANHVSEPSLQVGAKSGLWGPASGEITKLKSEIVGSTRDLAKLLLGPRGFLHDFVSPNWDLGALYTVLEFNILEMIPLDGAAEASQLSLNSGIPVDKLLRILRLTASENILEETHEGIFRHTAISEALLTDPKFKAFIGFQLFETRIASAHLADSLKQKANDYRTGQSAFKYAWGVPLYEWYKTHPEKSARFDKAMEGVAQSLDPGNALFCDWFQKHAGGSKNLVIDVGGGNGHIAKYLAEQFDTLSFSVQDSSETLLSQGREGLGAALQSRIQFEKTDFFAPRPQGEATTVLAYVMRNVLWNWSDEDAVRIIQTFVPILKQAPGTVLLVNDGISPVYKAMSNNLLKPYRRRDVTVMTMHNTRQRTEAQWAELFKKADQGLQSTLATAFSPHSFRGLWELRWAGQLSADGQTNGNGHA